MNFSKGSTIVAFGAHPDDIEVGMGGTLAYLSSSFKVFPVIATVPNNKRTRVNEAKNAAALLGIRQPIFLNISKNDFLFTRKVVTLIDKLVDKLDPDYVFTHWIGDSHQDHQNLTKVVISVCRKNRSSLFMYESMIPGGITDKAFRAQLYVDISAHFKKKISSIRASKTQLSKHGASWLKGIEGRSRLRGFEIGTKYAEAFEVIKIVHK